MNTEEMIPLDNKELLMGTVEPIYLDGQSLDDCAIRLSFVRGAVEKYKDKSFNDELVDYIRRIII